MEDLFVKARDLFWAREDDSESESEVPTFEASDDDADAPARRRRRTQAEVHGTVPTRTSGRIARAQRSESPAAAARPRDVHGEAMPMTTRRLGKGDLTTEERALFFGDVQACLARGETIKAVAQRWGVSEKLYRQLKAKMAVHGTLESRKKGRVGRKKKVTGALYESFVNVNRDARGDKTYRELSQALYRKTGMRVHASTLKRTADYRKWRLVPKYTAPSLSPEQMEERRKWALHHLSNDWEAHIDVDEKWFYTATRKRKTKVDPQWAAEGGPGRRPCSSKRHIPKVMFMAAVAKPNPQQRFDGRIGCFRCSVPDVTKRKSKNRDKGMPYERDVTVDAEFFEKMMREKIMPAAVKRMSWASKITIQLDNARPHTGKNVLEKLNAHGATFKPPITFLLQPANSPDTNLNDLCFCNSMASAVSKKITTNTEALAKEVQEVYWKWHTAEKLTKLWALKSAVLARIVANDGGNQYNMPHGVLAEAKGRAPVNRPR